MDENQQETDKQKPVTDIKESNVDTGSDVLKRTRNPASNDTQQSAVVADGYRKKTSKGIDVAKTRIGSHSDSTNQDDSSPSASPPRKKLISQLKEKLEDEKRAQRVQIAHEIVANEDFKLRDSPEEERVPSADDKSPEANLRRLEKTIKDVAHRAFWAVVREGIESDPPRYDHAFVLLQEIKDILLSLLPANRVTQYHKRIQEYMDLNLFKQQAENDALDVKAITTFIIDVMASMCAPVRDEQVAALRPIDDVVDLFQEIHKVLKLMQIDFANFSIKVVRPHIQHQQFEYERSEFTKLLKNSPDGLKHTHEWISRTYQEICNELKKMKEHLDQESKLGASGVEKEGEKELEKITKSALSPLSVLKSAYTTLLLPDYKLDNLPETLQMDRKRVEVLRIKVDQLVLVSSVMITSCGVFGQPLASHQAFLTKLKETLMTLTELGSNEDGLDQLIGISLQCWKEAQDYAKGRGPEVERCVTPSKENFLKTKITALKATRSHPVYSVLYKRTIEYLRVTADTIANHASTTPPTLSSPPAGLLFVTREIVDVALQYSKLINLNKTIYGPFYAPILREVIGIQKASNHSASPRQKREEDATVSPEDKGARRKLDMLAPDVESAPGKHKVAGRLDDLD